MAYTLGGNADVYQKKGLAEKAIRKTVKTKGQQNGNGKVRQWERIANSDGLA
jgi:hypothetical protein